MAKIYAEIDCGDQVADLIGGKDVQKRIKELDRRGKTMKGEKYLTYPENARYFLDEKGGGSKDGEEDRLKLEEALKTFVLDEDEDEANPLAMTPSSLAERAMDMPLVAVRRKGKENDDAKMYMVKSTKRPPKRMVHDFTIGRLPDRRIEDEELDEENAGEFAYRDLESID